MPGPRTQSERYTLLGQQLLRQQTEVAKLYSERLLSARETAEALGGVTVATVRAYARKGLLRSVRVGRYGWYRFPLSSVRELLMKGTK